VLANVAVISLVGFTVVVVSEGEDEMELQVPVGVKKSKYPTTVTPLLQVRRLASHELLSVRSEARAHLVLHIAVSVGKEKRPWKH
jgi:hypothetical protein